MTHRDDRDALDELDELARGELDATDVQILQELRGLWTAVDPPPDGLTERVQFAMTVAALEAEVARIVQQGALESAAVRSDYERVSTMTFASESVSAMIDIEDGGADGRRTVHGWVSENAIEVELRERHRSRRVAVDATGRFSFEGVEPGLVHFVFRHTTGGDERPVITPAFEL